MNLISDDSRKFNNCRIEHMVNIGESILGSSETEFMNSTPYVFDVDYVAKIRSGLSITVLVKKNSTKLPLKKGDLSHC